NTQSHPTSLIQSSSSSSLAAVTSTSATTTSSSTSLTANTTLVSNYGRLPSSTTNKQQQQHPSNATSSTVYSTSSSSSSSTASSASSNANTTPNTQQQTLTATDASGNPLPPQGAEIKIPAVGATPVAVSTKLPAAVQQLTQQGHIPGRPLGGRHGMVFGQIPAPPAVGNTTVPLVPGGTPLIPCSIAQGSTTLRRNGNGVVTSSNTPPPLYSPTPSGLLVPAGSASAATAAAAAGGSSAATTPNSNQEFSFKAKQEVDVMRRIMELQREGLWTEKRLPKQMEPPRPKAHWDYLLEEMVWLAADFAQERKWKKAAAKKCAKMVQKYFQDKANAAQKAEKAQELHLKRVAAFIAKEVKMFWGNVEKLVEYKHHTKIEEKRKKALDQHLSFIVDQTEKFSQQLAEGMNKTIKDASTNPSINSSRISSPKRDNTDDEFRPDSASEDDEETIAKAEEEDNADVDAEVAALEKESQMDLDDFLKDLPKGYLENRDKIVLEEDTTATTSSGAATSTSKKDTDSDDGEFEANETSEDDENTISKQEEEEMDVDHQKEIDELEADNDLTVEELMAKYKSGQVDNDTKASTSNRKIKKVVDFEDEDEVISRAMRDSDDDSTADEEDESDDEEEVETDSEDDEEEEDENAEETEENEQDAGLKSLLEDSTNANNSSKDDMIKDAAALAESLQPKGNTLSSTNVVTPVPFLLKHSLREYQHIGLDWLVTMNERKLNGILADEMGLGKTIQTIALLAHLACVKGNWGPHLIVVPSSVMLNWEMEFKKWCPGFKILTYYGSQKERKLKRVGWTKPNAFHVCITSYKLVVQDQQSFRRKKWKYLILDEAQNIKNFKSQRWQLLLNFSTERRLLLTGTPLQNDLMELWSLMHFLMPYVFSSHREFKEWFSNPMTGMIEGNMEYNEQLIQRLHKVIRPFLLRRLKKEVEKQMPKKYEHVVMCRLSNRQRYLYDDFMSRSKTRETLSTGNLLSVINVLMQLRKVCNHPNMFEVRPTLSPFQMEGISYETSRLICDLMEYDPFTQIDLHSLNLLLVELELTLTAYVSHKSRLLAAPRKLIEEIDTIPEPPPRCPTGKYKFHIRVRDVKVQQSINTHARQTVKVGASPAMRKEGNKFVPVNPALATMPAVGAGVGETTNSRIGKRINNVINPVGAPKLGPITPACITTRSRDVSMTDVAMGPTPAKQLKLQDTINGETLKTTVKTEQTRDDKTLVAALAQQVKTNSSSRLNEDITVKTEPKDDIDDDTSSELDPIYNMSDILQQRKEQRLARLKLMANVNKRRTEATPIYGADCRESIEQCKEASNLLRYSSWQTRGLTNCSTAMTRRGENWTLNKMLKSYEQRCEDLKQIFQNFVIYVPSACAPRIRFYVNNLTSRRYLKEQQVESTIQREMSPKLTMLHPIISAMTTQFPDPRLIQYDCGKLQTMDRLLKQLKSGHHRVLIFTQMTKMLDVLEAFLNYHGHIYLRLDGATKVEQRQLLMERFNTDKRIFCFILSTRSGGVGINLTGADTVIFYDSDWNPTMDAQAQDRCHRIGQTRDVHIYRLVSEKTIEVNILKKANQKRMLSDMAIEGGNFTTSFFKSSTIKDLFNVETQQQMGDNSNNTTTTTAQQEAYDKPSTSTAVLENTEVDLEKQSLKAFESALAAAEDEQDVQATKTAKAEVAADLAEFDENIPLDETTTAADTNVELSKADLEMQNLVKQLSPIERYAMRFVEETGAAWTAEQLRAAEAELEAQKREWEANRLAALQKEAELLKQEESAEEPLTYSRKDATNQVNKSTNNKNNNKNRSNKTNIAAKRKMQTNKQRLAALRNRKGSSTTATAQTAGAKAQRNRRELQIRRRRSSTRLQKKPTTTKTARQDKTRVRNRSSRGESNNNSTQDESSNDSNSEEVSDENEEEEADEEEDENENLTEQEDSENDTQNEELEDEEDNELQTSEEGSGDEDEQEQESVKKKIVKQTNKFRKLRKVIDYDEDEIVNRRRLRSLNRSAASRGSLNSSSNKETLTSSRTKQAKGQKSSCNVTNRKTTRTSMAAAAAAGNDLKTSSKTQTGVKNQKLLSFAQKRMQQKRRQEILRKKQQETTEQRKRKLSVSPGKGAATSTAKRRATVTANTTRRVLRHSPRKAAQKEEEHENEEEEDEGEEDKQEDLTLEDDSQETIEHNETEDDELEESETDEHKPVREKAKTTKTKTNAPRTIHNLPIRSRGGKTMKMDEEEDNEEKHEDNENTHDIDYNEEDDDKSSYATAGDNDNYGEDDDDDNYNHSEEENPNHQQRHNQNQHQPDAGNSSSMDVWAAHNQDTTTNSTYYNVSDESESEDNDSLSNLNSTIKKTPLSANKSNTTSHSSLRNQTGNSTPQQQNDNHTPRTRSRGSVKINLWTLDESPVLPTITRHHHHNAGGKVNRNQHKSDDETLKAHDHKTAIKATGSSSIKKTKNNETPTKTASTSNTLHRWLLKTPRNQQQQQQQQNEGNSTIWISANTMEQMPVSTILNIFILTIY
ncbi:Helicase domino, partial [Lucilia cuprina]